MSFFPLLLASKRSIIWNNVTRKCNRKTSVPHQVCAREFQVVRIKNRLSVSQGRDEIVQVRNFRSGNHLGCEGLTSSAFQLKEFKLGGKSWTAVNQDGLVTRPGAMVS